MTIVEKFAGRSTEMNFLKKYFDMPGSQILVVYVGSEPREKGASVAKYPDYDELFTASVREKETEKQILVIDEFHHMLKGDTEFFEKLAEFQESRLLSRPVMIVLCTSASGWVENHLVGKIGSRASVIGGFLKVREFDFAGMRSICSLICWSGEAVYAEKWKCIRSRSSGSRGYIIPF